MYNPAMLNNVRDRLDVFAVINLLPDQAQTLIRTHMSTIPKTTLYVLALTGLCNFFLMWSTFTAYWLPNMGFNTLMILILSCVHNVVAYMTLLQPDHPRTPFFTATEFMIGNLSGSSLGLAILHLVASIYYGRLSHCQPWNHLFPTATNRMLTNATTAAIPTCTNELVAQANEFQNHMQHHERYYLCTNKGAMWGIWFWSGLLFWLHLWLMGLMSSGKDQFLSSQARYQDIGLSADEIEMLPPQGQPPREQSGYQNTNPHQGDSTFFEGDFPAHQRT